MSVCAIAGAGSRSFSWRIAHIADYEQALHFLFWPRKPGAFAYAAEHGAA
jgi:hypothetical protein